MADKDGLDDAVVTLRQLTANHQAPQHATLTSTEPDAIDQVRRLAELRDAGILSDDEFQRKKSELLGL